MKKWFSDTLKQKEKTEKYQNNSETMILSGLNDESEPVMNTLFSFRGLPENLNDDEDTLKKILDFRLRELTEKFEGKGRIKQISEIKVYLNGNKSENRDSISTSDDTDLKDNFSVYTPLYDFDKVILPDNTKNQIIEVLDALKHQNMIFIQWGFKELEPHYNVALNFFGPPGTGKTMSAHAVANYLNKKILMADYAQIESKFVGDAPKNLEAVFKKAEQEDALLFFDEADSFLGKRIAGISTGSEQAINSLRSQMLLALDRHSGIVIFASNFIENYDKAFETRIRHIKFNLPDEYAIMHMFRSMMPELAPTKKINFAELAKDCSGLSGRDIKNILILSAIKAARKSEKIINQKGIVDSINTIKESLNSFINSDNNLSELIRNKIKEKSDE